MVERHVANVNVEGSSPFARFHFTPISVFPIGVFYFRGVLKKVKRFAERVAHRAQESETLCRKGGTSRSDNAPLASRACAGAKLACGATLSATREFLGLAWVLNLLVAPVFLRRGNLRGSGGCSTCLWCHPFCDAGIFGACVGAQLACGVTLSATREFAGLARVLSSRF